MDPVTTFWPYCVLCMMNLQSAATYVRVLWTTDVGSQSATYHERGSQAVPGLEKLLAEKREIDPNAYIVMNAYKLGDDGGNLWNGGLRASTVVNGNATCSVHVYDEWERTLRR